VPSALLKKNIAVLGAAALIWKRLDHKSQAHTDQE
jgi:hypothetical protein